MDILECIKTRRSTRNFTDTAIESEKLSLIIEAGRFAPSGGNSQTSHFIVITNKEVLRELSDIAREEFAKMETYDGMYKSLVSSITLSKRGDYIFHYNAPALIVIANKKGYGNAMADSCCALENMAIAANALDIGSCYINQLHWLDDNARVNAYLCSLGLNEDETVCCSLALGYAETLNRAVTERRGNTVTYVK